MSYAAKPSPAQLEAIVQSPLAQSLGQSNIRQVLAHMYPQNIPRPSQPAIGWFAERIDERIADVARSWIASEQIWPFKICRRVTLEEAQWSFTVREYDPVIAAPGAEGTPAPLATYRTQTHFGVMDRFVIGNVNFIDLYTVKDGPDHVGKQIGQLIRAQIYRAWILIVTFILGLELYIMTYQGLTGGRPEAMNQRLSRVFDLVFAGLDRDGLIKTHNEITRNYAGNLHKPIEFNLVILPHGAFNLIEHRHSKTTNRAEQGETPFFTKLERKGNLYNTKLIPGVMVIQDDLLPPARGYENLSQRDLLMRQRLFMDKSMMDCNHLGLAHLSKGGQWNVVEAYTIGISDQTRGKGIYTRFGAAVNELSPFINSCRFEQKHDGSFDFSKEMWNYLQFNKSHDDAYVWTNAFGGRFLTKWIGQQPLEKRSLSHDEAHGRHFVNAIAKTYPNKTVQEISVIFSNALNLMNQLSSPPHNLDEEIMINYFNKIAQSNPDFSGNLVQPNEFGFVNPFPVQKTERTTVVAPAVPPTREAERPEETGGPTPFDIEGTGKVTGEMGKEQTPEILEGYGSGVGEFADLYGETDSASAKLPSFEEYFGDLDEWPDRPYGFGCIPGLRTLASMYDRFRQKIPEKWLDDFKRAKEFIDFYDQFSMFVAEMYPFSWVLEDDACPIYLRCGKFSTMGEMYDMTTSLFVHTIDSTVRLPLWIVPNDIGPVTTTIDSLWDRAKNDPDAPEVLKKEVYYETCPEIFREILDRYASDAYEIIGRLNDRIQMVCNDIRLFGKDEEKLADLKEQIWSTAAQLTRRYPGRLPIPIPSSNFRNMRLVFLPTSYQNPTSSSIRPSDPRDTEFLYTGDKGTFIQMCRSQNSRKRIRDRYAKTSIQIDQSAKYVIVNSELMKKINSPFYSEGYDGDGNRDTFAKCENAEQRYYHWKLSGRDVLGRMGILNFLLSPTHPGSQAHMVGQNLLPMSTTFLMIRPKMQMWTQCSIWSYQEALIFFNKQWPLGIHGSVDINQDTIIYKSIAWNGVEGTEPEGVVVIPDHFPAGILNGFSVTPMKPSIQHTIFEVEGDMIVMDLGSSVRRENIADNMLLMGDTHLKEALRNTFDKERAPLMSTDELHIGFYTHAFNIDNMENNYDISSYTEDTKNSFDGIAHWAPYIHEGIEYPGSGPIGKIGVEAAEILAGKMVFDPRPTGMPISII